MNWVIMSVGSNLEMYVGQTEDADFVLRDKISRGEMIELHECRVIRTVLLPNNMGSVTQSSIFMPYSINRGPAQVWLRPVSFMIPDDDTVKLIERQIKASEENDTKHRAADAGLVLPKKSPA